MTTFKQQRKRRRIRNILVFFVIIIGAMAYGIHGSIQDEKERGQASYNNLHLELVYEMGAYNYHLYRYESEDSTSLKRFTYENIGSKKVFLFYSLTDTLPDLAVLGYKGDPVRVHYFINSYKPKYVGVVWGQDSSSVRFSKTKPKGIEEYFF
jgi:hypothetical protein